MVSWRGPHHPRAGGAETVAHEHAKYWMSKGHTVTLFTSCYENAKKDEIIDGIRILRRGGEILGSKLEFITWYLFSNKEIYDIVIDEFHGIPFFTPLFIKAKKIAFIHEVTKNIWLYNPWPKPFYYLPVLFGTLFEPLIFKYLYKDIPFMTVSESTKKDLLSFGICKENIYVVKNGTEQFTNKNVKKEKRKTAIFLGALAKDKGIEDALHAFSEINKKDKDWQFWIVGKGDSTYQSRLSSQIIQLGIEENTKFWGFVSHDEKFDLLNRAHVLINPSYREGWGLTVIEAASVGTPTIGYDVPGLQDSIINGKTGILCESNTSISLSNNTINLVSDKALYKTISRNAFTWSKSFSWQKSGKMSLQVLFTIIRR